MSSAIINSKHTPGRVRYLNWQDSVSWTDKTCSNDDADDDSPSC